MNQKPTSMSAFSARVRLMRGVRQPESEVSHWPQARRARPSRDDREVEAELGHGMPLLEPRPGHAFPVPPLAEVIAREAPRRHVMVQRHLGHVESARARRARAAEELCLLLTEERRAAA